VAVQAVAAGGASSNASLDLSGSSITAGAQPADDPHFVKCSDGAVANPCLVTGSGTAGTAATGVITVQGIASATPVIVGDGSGALNVIVDSSALPSGAATAARQPALGTAGSSSTDVLSIQGVASGTAVPVSGSITCSNCSGTGVSVNEDVASANADPGTPAYTVRSDTLTSTTSANGDYQPQKSTALGAMWVSPVTPLGDSVVNDTADAVKFLCVDATGTTCASDTQAQQDGALGTITSVTGGMLFARGGSTSPTAASANDDAVLVSSTLQGAIRTQANYAGTDAATNTGASSAATPRTVTASDSPDVTALQLIDNPVGSLAGGTAGTSSFAAGGVYVASAPTLTNGQQAALQLSSTGALVVTGSAGTTQYAEDAAHSSGDQIVAIGCVRRDTSPTSSSGTAGDYSTCITDGNGRLYVNSSLYDSAGTAAMDTTAHAVKTLAVNASGAALTEDSQAVWGGAGTFTAGSAPTGGLGFWGRASASAPSTTGVIDDDYVLPWLSAAGSQHTICDSGCGSGTQYTHDAALTVGSTVGTINAGRASAAAPTDVSADNDAVMAWMLRSGATVTQPSFGGVLATAGNGASGTGVQRVTIANDSTGVLATVSTVTTLTGGGVAHDGADSGNPIKIGYKADANLSDNSLVSTGDRADAMSDLDGALITRPWAPLGDLLRESVTNTNGSSTAFTAGLGAPGSGIRIYLTKCTLANSSATFITVDLRDGVSGSVLWTIPVPATSGAVENFVTPIPLTANTALAFDASAATTTLTISCTGFKSKI
jgi:hypothetical protein